MPTLPPAGSVHTTTGITTATVVKATPGWVFDVMEIVDGTTNGTVHNCATTGAATTANQILTVSSTGVTNDIMNFRCVYCDAGIVVIPGTGQTLAISYT